MASKQSHPAKILDASFKKTLSHLSLIRKAKIHVHTSTRIKQYMRVWVCASMIRHMPSVHKVLDQIPIHTHIQLINETNKVVYEL